MGDQAMLRAMQQPQRPLGMPRRSGFTLVELVIVIAIIAILVSLISAAVFVALRNIVDTTARNDINQVHTGLSGFHQKFRKYPPSLIILANVGPGRGTVLNPSPYDLVSPDDGLNALRTQSL